MVIVHYIQIDVLYLQIGGPGHQYHNHARENENVVFLKIRIPLLIGLNKKCFNGAINGIGIKICRERGGLGEFLPGGVKAAAIAVQMLTQYIK